MKILGIRYGIERALICFFNHWKSSTSSRDIDILTIHAVFWNICIHSGIPVIMRKSLWFAQRAPFGRFFWSFLIVLKFWNFGWGFLNDILRCKQLDFFKFPPQFRVIKISSTFMWNLRTQILTSGPQQPDKQNTLYTISYHIFFAFHFWTFFRFQIQDILSTTRVTAKNMHHGVNPYNGLNSVVWEFFNFSTKKIVLKS